MALVEVAFFQNPIEAEIARQLGMSRTPVREALVRLGEDGLVELLPRRGMRVSWPTQSWTYSPLRASDWNRGGAPRT
jgi:DNA-binding FadR family transcriptional regulator